MKLLIYKMFKIKLNIFRVKQTILVYVNVCRMIVYFKNGLVMIIFIDYIDKHEEIYHEK